MILIVNGVQQAVSVKTDLLTRAVIISLFSWRRANPDDDTDHPQGWWGDSYPTIQNDRIGSRLYLLTRSKLTTSTLALAKKYIEEALQWMKDDDVIAQWVIDVVRVGDNMIKANITLYKSDGTDHSIGFDNLWSALNDG